MLEDTIKKINICFVTDDNYVQHVGVAIASILQNADDDEYFDFYIFDDGIKEINKDKLNTFNSSKVSVKYVDLSGIQHDFSTLKQTVPYISKTSYYKFIIADSLPDIDKIIYLDGDLVVKESLWNLYNINLNKFLICAVEDIGYSYWCNYKEELKLKFKCMNSGVMLINCDLWRKENLSQKFIECAKDHDKVGFGQDQPVLNYVMKDRVKFIPYKWNVQDSFYRKEPERINNINCEAIIEATNQPAIIHYTYIEKPWNNIALKKASEYWNYYKNSPFYNEEIYYGIQQTVNSTVKEKLQIFIITYNRIKYLKNTLESILESPIKDFDITILDNASTDGSSELIDEYCTKHQNLKHIRHNRNIGGNANICRAFEMSKKEYFWTLCDDDEFDFSSWSEIQNAIISDGYDMIFTINNEGIKLPYTIPVLLFFASLVPGVIYKSSNIDTNTLFNMYGTINTWFPQAVPVIDILVNKNGNYFIPTKNIVNRVTVEQIDGKVFYRGQSISDIHPDLERMYWHVGYMKALKLVKDKKKRKDLTIKVRFNQLFNTTNTNYIRFVVDYNAKYRNNNIDNYWDIFSNLSLIYKLYFIYYVLIGINLPIKSLPDTIKAIICIFHIKLS